MKTWIRHFFCIGGLLTVIAVALTACAGRSAALPDGDCTVTMLDVGQGLALCVEADGRRMLYDGGGRDSSSYVISWLNQHGWDRLNLMAASHYDEDHIAGLVGCLRNYSVEMILCPEYRGDTNIYRSFEAALRDADATVVHPTVGDEFALGRAVITVVGPAGQDADRDNNNSIALRIQYGDFVCLVTGDAEAEEEAGILAGNRDLKADLYVAGHHGSKYSSTEDLVKAVQPAAAWISCGRGNAYGHPAQETMDVLEKYGVSVFRTDLQGEVSCHTDGGEITFSVPACEDHSPGDPAAAILNADTGESGGDRGTGSEIRDYVLNEHTKKIHLPGCSSAAKMSEKNRREVTASRDDLLAEGYSPCGNCKP